MSEEVEVSLQAIGLGNRNALIGLFTIFPPWFCNALKQFLSVVCFSVFETHNLK